MAFAPLLLLINTAVNIRVHPNGRRGAVVNQQPFLDMCFVETTVERTLYPAWRGPPQQLQVLAILTPVGVLPRTGTRRGPVVQTLAPWVHSSYTSTAHIQAQHLRWFQLRSEQKQKFKG